jgi:hypothetical protein
MIRAFLIGAVLAFVVAGCGNYAGKPQKGADAALRVKHVVDGTQGLYVEGSVWHVRVVDSNGDAVLDRKLADDSVVVSLQPGRYELQSEEFPCDGNCSNLDPATDRCSEELTVQSGQQAATVTLKPGHGCSIAVLKSVRT